MFLGRFFGLLLLTASVLIASAEAVAALGTGEYIGIATSDVFTIITGFYPQSVDSLPAKILMWPAWASMGILGTTLTFFCRKKKPKSAFAVK